MKKDKELEFTCDGQYGGLTEKPEPTSLDYAREILEMSLTTLRECYTDPTYYAKVAPGVNGALANFMAAEAAELEDSRR